MTKASVEELVKAVRPRYVKGSRGEKTSILDEFVAVTGDHRKVAIRRLRGAKRRKGTKRKGRPPVYTPAVVTALWQVWEICGRISSKRLAPFPSEAMAVLEREGEIRFPTEIGDRLIWMSPASIDRLLGPTAIASERDDAPPNRGRCCAYRFRCARLRIGRTLSRGFSRSTWAHTVLRPLPGSSSTP